MKFLVPSDGDVFLGKYTILINFIRRTRGSKIHAS